MDVNVVAMALRGGQSKSMGDCRLDLGSCPENDLQSILVNKCHDMSVHLR